MLDDDFKVAFRDFGLIELADTKITHVTIQVLRTPSYIVIENLLTKRLLDKRSF